MAFLYERYQQCMVWYNLNQKQITLSGILMMLCINKCLQDSQKEIKVISPLPKVRMPTLRKEVSYDIFPPQIHGKQIKYISVSKVLPKDDKINGWDGIIKMLPEAKKKQDREAFIWNHVSCMWTTISFSLSPPTLNHLFTVSLTLSTIQVSSNVLKSFFFFFFGGKGVAKGPPTIFFNSIWE